ncbi:hypothetical protein [Streptomyces sp. NPDC001594]|uniref:hypothetical protein n=1 Tax=Streptomyces sp. NPDC001594 TaxID=3364590 RepID=UPI0036C86C96
MAGNAVLRARMADLGLTQDELADRMNSALLEITGRPGDVSAPGHAENALAKADLDVPRAPWIGFYGPAELAAIAAIVHELLDQPAYAEAASHRALASLPGDLRRNRSMAIVRLGSAQLHQGEAEQACATTSAVFGLMADNPLPGRLRTMIGDFHRSLFTVAPSAQVAREWADRYRTEWSTA